MSSRGRQPLVSGKELVCESNSSRVDPVASGVGPQLKGSVAAALLLAYGEGARRQGAGFPCNLFLP